MPKPTPEEYQFFDEAHGKTIDNPGPEWLSRKIAEGGHAITGYYKHPIMMPVAWLKTLNGENGEHLRLRGPKPDGSGNYGAQGDRHPAVMDQINRMKNGTYKFTPIHVVAKQNNAPTVFEGNHKIESADEIGMDCAPVELHHVNGNNFHPLDVIHEYEDSRGK